MALAQADTTSAEPPKGLPPMRLEFIDALRGFASLSVVLYHTFLCSPQSVLNDIHLRRLSYVKGIILLIVSLGSNGVPLFLCLSGFCLFLPVVRRNPLNSVRVDFPKFMRRRVHRLLPPYYIALLGTVVVRVLCRHHGFFKASNWEVATGGSKSVLLHLVMLHNLSPAVVGDIIGPAWTLAVEFQLYLAFPLFLWLVRRGGLPLLLGATCALSALWFQIARAHVPAASYLSDSGWVYIACWYRSPFAFCWFFALGMTGAVLVGDSQYDRIRRRLIVAGTVALPFAFGLSLSPRPIFATDFCWGLAFLGLILAMSAIDHTRFQGTNLFSAFAKLGIFSYSVYLIHASVLNLLMRTNTKYDVIWPAIEVFGGWLFFLVAEKPFLNKPIVTDRRPA